MDGVTIQTSSNTPGTLTGWSIQDIGDYDGDGKSDILWHNPSSGDFAVWLMSGVTLKDKDIASRYSKGNWKSVPNGSNVKTLFNTGTSTSNLSPTQGYSSNAVTITGSGFTDTSKVTFGSYAAKDVSFVSENELVAYVPFAVVDDKVSGLPQGSYSVSVDGKEIGSFLVQALPNNPYPSGTVLKGIVSSMTDDFVSHKEAVQSAIAAMKASTTDAKTIEFLDGLSAIMPELETLLHNEVSNTIDQIEPTALATIEQTILANSRKVDFKSSSPGDPQGSLINRSTLIVPRESCSSMGGDNWLEGRGRLTRDLLMYEQLNFVLNACNLIPGASCICKIFDLISDFSHISKLVELEAYGKLEGIRMEATVGQDGTATESLLKIKLSPETESFLKPSVRTSKNTPKKVADAVINTVSTVLSCTPATVYSPFIKAVTELAKKAQGLTDSEFGSETCPISFSNLAKHTNGYNGRELFVYDDGSIKWMRTKPDSPASVYFKLKDKYLTMGESLSFDKYEVRVSVKRFKDNGDGSMTDTYTDLQWMKVTDGCNGYVTWDVANTCVPSGWRLPTIQELYSLCRTDGTTTGLNAMLSYDWDAPEPNPKPNWSCNGTGVDRWSQLSDEGFDVRTDFYWSSTTFAYNTSYAWNVHMHGGYVDFAHKSYHPHYVWPVRSGH